MRAATLLTCLFVFYATAIFAAEAIDMDEKLALEDTLSNVMTTNSNADDIIIAAPKTATAAGEIIERALWLAKWNNEWRVKEDSDKENDGSLIYPLKIRKNLVDEAICR
ncbi:MAG: hypothetical protein K2H64_08960, partial [Desulfovibrio sp.]|nr:hypothetical protein [Desulfovibrio sp.]